MLRDLRPLFSYMRRYKWGYLWGSLCVVGTNAVYVLFPKVLEKAIDGLRSGLTHQKLLLFVGAMVAIGIIKGFFLYAQRWILIGISREIEFDLRNDLFRHLESQDSGFYQRYRTGDIMARMTNDLNAVRMLLGPAIMYSANTVVFTVGALFFLLRYSPYLTLVAFAPAPLASIVTQYLGRKIHDRFERIQASFSEISAQAQENYSGARLVRAFAREKSQISLFETLNRRVHRARPAPRSAHGHALAYAGVHPGRIDDHHPPCRRPPCAHPQTDRWPVRRFQHLHDPAHLAHHRGGLGGQHLPARHCLGYAH